ncbi:hypothetical protein LCGC14_3158810, partial [marine sediment metagenome]
MSILDKYLRRSAAIMAMPEAILSGMSASAFLFKI